MFTEQRKSMCGQCPFRRTTKKEYLDTRGQNGFRFVGQAAVNAVLPCHMENADGNAEVGVGRQCAGAAKYRANCGYDNLHPGIGKLPEDHKGVFSNPVELLAHHIGCSEDDAMTLLKARGGVDGVSTEEMMKAMAAGRCSVARK